MLFSLNQFAATSQQMKVMFLEDGNLPEFVKSAEWSSISHGCSGW